MEFQYLPWILLNSKKKSNAECGVGNMLHLIKGAFRLGKLRLVIKNEIWWLKLCTGKGNTFNIVQARLS